MWHDLLFNVSNRSSTALLSSCSARVRMSRNCRPCLPSQFLIICPLSTWFVLYVWNMLFNLKFLHSVYLSVVFQSMVGSFIVGPPSLGPVPTDSSPLGLVSTSVLAIVSACTAAFTGLHYCLGRILCVCYFLLIIFSLLLKRLSSVFFQFYFRNHVLLRALVKITLVVLDVHVYSMFLWYRLFTCDGMVYIPGVHIDLPKLIG